MRKITLKKTDVFKWLTQFCVSSLFVMLAFKFFVYGGNKGAIFGNVFVSCTLACALGVIVGDLSLYKRKKFIISTIPVLIVSALIGVWLGFFFIELVTPLSKLPHVGPYIDYAFWLAGTSVPPIICYNALTKSRRRYWAKVTCKPKD